MTDRRCYRSINVERILLFRGIILPNKLSWLNQWINSFHHLWVHKRLLFVEISYSVLETFVCIEIGVSIIRFHWWYSIRSFMSRNKIIILILRKMIKVWWVLEWCFLLSRLLILLLKLLDHRFGFFRFNENRLKNRIRFHLMNQRVIMLYFIFSTCRLSRWRFWYNSSSSIRRSCNNFLLAFFLDRHLQIFLVWQIRQVG